MNHYYFRICFFPQKKDITKQQELIVNSLYKSSNSNPNIMRYPDVLIIYCLKTKISWQEEHGRNTQVYGHFKAVCTYAPRNNVARSKALICYRCAVLSGNSQLNKTQILVWKIGQASRLFSVCQVKWVSFEWKENKFILLVILINLHLLRELR